MFWLNWIWKATLLERLSSTHSCARNEHGMLPLHLQQYLQGERLNEAKPQLVKWCCVVVNNMCQIHSMPTHWTIYYNSKRKLLNLLLLNCLNVEKRRESVHHNICTGFSHCMQSSHIFVDKQLWAWLANNKCLVSVSMTVARNALHSSMYDFMHHIMKQFLSYIFIFKLSWIHKLQSTLICSSKVLLRNTKLTSMLCCNSVW